MNGFFAHKDIHKYTWYQHTRGIKSIIDYIVLKQQTNIRVQDVKVNRGAECGSDHCLVVAKIYIPFPGVRSGKTEESSAMLENVKYKLDSFENESTRLLYGWRLERKLNELERSTTEEYEHIKACIKAAAEEALGIDNNQKYNRPYWWDREIEEKIRHKKEIYKKLLQSRDDETRAEYKRINRQVKQEVIKRKNKTWEKKCDYIDKHLGGTRSSEAWKTIKAMRTTSRNKVVMNSISHRQWIEHFTDLLVESREKYLKKEDYMEPTSKIELHLDEIKVAVKGAKLKKAPVPGGIKRN